MSREAYPKERYQKDFRELVIALEVEGKV